MATDKYKENSTKEEEKSLYYIIMTKKSRIKLQKFKLLRVVFLAYLVLAK